MSKKIICKNNSEHGEYEAEMVILGNREIYSPCPKCYEEKKAQEKAIKISSNIEEKKRIIRSSGIPESFIGGKLETFKLINDKTKTIIRTLTEYRNSFKFETIENDNLFLSKINGPNSLLFYGKVGTGKTDLACRLAQELVFWNKTKSIQYIDTYFLNQHFKNAWRKDSAQTQIQLFQKYCNYDFLIIDEVGIQFDSVTETVLFFNLYNQRFYGEKPTCLITNLDKPEIRKKLGDRIADRLNDKKNLSFNFDWESYRGRERDTL